MISDLEVAIIISTAVYAGGNIQRIVLVECEVRMAKRIRRTNLLISMLHIMRDFPKCKLVDHFPSCNFVIIHGP